jgi:uncharacterized protein YndB with AHSA1/START domain
MQPALEETTGVDCAVEVPAPIADVWRAWTTSEGAQSFFAQEAHIRLALGGEYEIQFHPTDERQGTKGLKILSFAPPDMLSFQWNAPPHLPAVRAGGTWVIVNLTAIPPQRTHVRLRHLGWQSGEEWDLAREHFRRGWEGALDRLVRRFSSGPIDWAAEPMMWQERERGTPTSDTGSGPR